MLGLEPDEDKLQVICMSKSVEAQRQWRITREAYRNTDVNVLSLTPAIIYGPAFYHRAVRGSL